MTVEERVRPAADKYQQALAATNADNPNTLAARNAFAVALRDEKRFTGAAYHLKAVLEARQRIEMRVCPGNVAARRVAEKAGFTYEGLLRNAGHVHSGRVDLEMWSMVTADLK